MEGVLDPVALLQEFVEIPGPPGQEEAVAEAFAFRAAEMGYDPQVDAKGNVRIAMGPPPYRVVVTAHPSYLLRLPDLASKAAAYSNFVEDLRIAHASLGEG